MVSLSLSLLKIAAYWVHFFLKTLIVARPVLRASRREGWTSPVMGTVIAFVMLTSIRSLVVPHSDSRSVAKVPGFKMEMSGLLFAGLMDDE